MKTNPNDPIDWSLVSLRETNDNGIAQCYMGGLTKREHFAAMALQGLLADPQRNGSISDYAEDAVKFADDLIEQLNKPKP